MTPVYANDPQPEPAKTGTTPAQRGETEERDDHYWALELDREKWPVRAHLIVGETGPGRFDYYLVACGDKLSKAWSGCWGTNGDKLPLQAHAVHCGLPLSGPSDA